MCKDGEGCECLGGGLPWVGLGWEERQWTGRLQESTWCTTSRGVSRFVNAWVSMPAPAPLCPQVFLLCNNESEESLRVGRVVDVSWGMGGKGWEDGLGRPTLFPPRYGTTQGASTDPSTVGRVVEMSWGMERSARKGRKGTRLRIVLLLGSQWPLR